MNMVIVSKKTTITDAIRTKIENTLGRLEKYINDDTDVKVKIDVKKKNQKIEVTIFTKDSFIIRAEESREDLYSAIDLIHDKLYKQLRKYKTQLMKKNKKNESIKFDNDNNESIRFDNIEEYVDYDIDNENIIKRRKEFKIDKPMTPEEAIMQMDLLEHNFFVFRSLETENINIVYKRHDGYGLIEQS